MKIGKKILCLCLAALLLTGGTAFAEAEVPPPEGRARY